MSLARERLQRGLLLAPAITTLVVLFGAALAGALRQSFDPTLLGGPASLSAWHDTLSDGTFHDAALFTLQVTAMATIASASVALLLAWYLRHTGTLTRLLANLPVPVPHVLVTVVAVVWLAPGGLADRMLGGLPFDLVRDANGLGITLVYAYKEGPFLLLLLLMVMGRHVAEREEMAAVLGGSSWKQFRHVVWPAVRMPLVLGSIVVAAFVLGSFEVPLAVGPTYPNTIATYALDATQIDLTGGRARAAVALILAAAASIALALAGLRVARSWRG